MKAKRLNCTGNVGVINPNNELNEAKNLSRATELDDNSPVHHIFLEKNTKI